MTTTSDAFAPAREASSGQSSPNYTLWAIFAACIGLLFVVFWDGLTLMARWWEREEYSHGYMIPLVAAFLVYQRLNELPGAVQRGAWFGVGALVTGLAGYFLGELSAIYTVIQYAFLLSLLGVVLSCWGWGGIRVTWVAFVYLIFMIPLPNFIYNNLSSELQLWSSEIGVAVIRLFGISVYLEGNVIDLGNYKLQVVEACSGLRYLFPLMSFGFLIAYLYRGPFWQRAVLFLSTIPITVLMNSFRIGVIGVTVDRWGIEMAEGFLHDFEGWVVFMACLAVLLLEIAVFHFATRQHASLWDRIHLDVPKIKVGLADFGLSWKRQRPLLVSFLILLVVTPFLVQLDEREELPPARESFDSFPLFHNGWIGHESSIETEILDTLQLTDYIKADYVLNRGGLPVNFYVAYYSSQRKGTAIHSPRSCIPGGGWLISDSAQHELTQLVHVNGQPLTVNRVVIRKGEVAQLVYYWFDGRGRNVTNEYVAKWYIFWDSMTRSRTDGALVRVVTPVLDRSQMAEADQRLQAFLRDFYPQLQGYIP